MEEYLVSILSLCIRGPNWLVVRILEVLDFRSSLKPLFTANYLLRWHLMNTSGLPDKRPAAEGRFGKDEGSRTTCLSDIEVLSFTH